MTITPLSVALALTLSIATPAAHAANANAAKAQAAAASYSATLTPRQRGEAVSAFVRKWGAYVENTYGIDVHTWAQRMVPMFAQGDAINIQRALARTTLEGATAELQGGGHKLSDQEAITKLAQLSNAALAPGVTPNALGDLTNDLVYTPITPCRIVDTRLSSGGGGPIAAMGVRAFRSYGIANYTSQGGSTTNCGMQTESPEAVVLNVTAVRPAGAGFATVYPAEGPRPDTSSINYVAGAIVNNTVVTPIDFFFFRDFRIYTFAESDYVVDIVGYYDAPHATALDCIEETRSSGVISSGSRSFESVACPAGYTVTGGGVQTGVNLNSFMNASQQFGTQWFSSIQNSSGSDKTYTHSATCCRVPGR